LSRMRENLGRRVVVIGMELRGTSRGTFNSPPANRQTKAEAGIIPILAQAGITYHFGV